MKEKLRKLLLKKKNHLKLLKFKTNKILRLSIFRSHNHIYAQIINDLENKTVVSCSTIDNIIKNLFVITKTMKSAYIVGEELGLRALKHGINKIKFERQNNQYKGRIRSLIEGIRKTGILI
jgi:large subunit ribosomal protein L18